MSYKFANPYRAVKSYRPGSPIGVGALGDTSCGTGGIYDPKVYTLPDGTKLQGQCIYPGMPGYDALKAGQSSSSDSGVLDTLLKIGGSLFGSKPTPAVQSGGAPYPYQQPSSTPAWILPVAIVGVGAVAAILLTRK